VPLAEPGINLDALRQLVAGFHAKKKVREISGAAASRGGAWVDSPRTTELDYPRIMPFSRPGPGRKTCIVEYLPGASCNRSKSLLPELELRPWAREVL